MSLVEGMLAPLTQWAPLPGRLCTYWAAQPPWFRMTIILLGLCWWLRQVAAVFLCWGCDAHAELARSAACHSCLHLGPPGTGRQGPGSGAQDPFLSPPSQLALYLWSSPPAWAS